MEQETQTKRKDMPNYYGIVDLDRRNSSLNRLKNLPAQNLLTLKEYDIIAGKIISNLSKKLSPSLRFNIKHNSDLYSDVIQQLVLADGTYNPRIGLTKEQWRGYLAYNSIKKFFNSASRAAKTKDLSPHIPDYRELEPSERLEQDNASEWSLVERAMVDSELTSLQIKCIRLMRDGKACAEIANILGYTRSHIYACYNSAISKIKGVVCGI